MASKEKSSKNEHYTSMEKKVFLQILYKYKHVIEVKKNDGTILKDKVVAWGEICNEFNQSTLICHERTVQQLKKLWANLKQCQREALTKEKQSLMATGGGPQEARTDVDPDIANIAPHFTNTAPVLFSSNMTEKEINDKRDFVFDIMSADESVEVLFNKEKEHVIYLSIKAYFFDYLYSTIFLCFVDTFTIAEGCNEELMTSHGTDMLKEHLNNNMNKPRVFKRKRKDLLEVSNEEEELRIQRLKNVVKQEETLANIKLKHEEKITLMKAEHLKLCNDLQLNHLKEIQEIEIEIKKSKLKGTESDKENIDLFVKK